MSRCPPSSPSSTSFLPIVSCSRSAVGPSRKRCCGPRAVVSQDKSGFRSRSSSRIRPMPCSPRLRFLYTNEVALEPLTGGPISWNKLEEREMFWQQLLQAAFVYLVPSLVEICVEQLTAATLRPRRRASSEVLVVETDCDLTSEEDPRYLRKVLDLLVFCDGVVATKPNTTHRRTSAKAHGTGSITSLENGSRAKCDVDNVRGLDRCTLGIHQLQDMCIEILETVPEEAFEVLVKSESGRRCSTERLCGILRRRSCAPLVIAVKYQLGRVVNELLRQGEPLDKTAGEDNDLPLVAALATGNDTIIRRLLVDTDAPYFLLTDKIPIFFLACSSGLLLHAEILIAHNATDINMMSPLEDGDKEIIAEFGKRQTPLHIASQKGHANIVELLLKNNAASNLQDDEGYTALHRAANVETAQVLLSSEFRTNPNIPNRRGQTALHIAAARGNVGVVNLLIHNNCDQDVKDDQGQSAFHVAAANGHTAVALILLHENESRQQELQRLQRDESTGGNEGSETVGTEEVVSLDSNATPSVDVKPVFDINEEDLKGNTALHLAAMSPSDRCQKMLQLLLESGADPNRANWFGYSPLHLFCSHQGGPASVVDIFIEHGANIFTQSLDGSTPLHLAVGRASEDVAVALVIAGAHVHLQDAAGRTVVDLAESTNQGTMLVPVLRNLSKAPEWVPDDQVQECSSCHAAFRVAMRKHHCRHCGRIICYNCSSNKIAIPKFQLLKPSRVCDTCYDVLSFRRLL